MSRSRTAILVGTLLTLVVVACFLFVSPGANAAVVVPLTLEELTSNSGTIVYARVLGTSAQFADADGISGSGTGIIETTVRLEVLDAVKGQTGRQMTIVVPGGTVGDLTFRLDCAPSFTLGEAALLFLDAHGQVVGGHQGKMSVVGEEVLSLQKPVGEVLSSVQALASGRLESRSKSMTLPAGLVSNRAPIGPNEAASTAVLLNEGFESGMGLWTLWGSPTWGATSYRAASGILSAYCVRSAVVPPGPYPNGSDAVMYAGPYDLSAVTSATLEYDLFLNTEINYDYCYAEASTNGTDFDGFGYSGDSGGWVSQSLDLSAVPTGPGTSVNMLGDSSVWVAFWFSSDGTVTDEGAYIDNVELVTDYTLPVVPTITNINPGSGSAGTDTEVTIIGTGFGASQGSGRVEFYYQGTERMTAPIVSWGDTSIACVIPTDFMSGGYPGSAASGPVTVVNSTGLVSSGYAFLVTFGYGGAKWDVPSCTYYVNANTPDTAGEEALIDSGAAAWNGASDFAFVDGGSTTATTWNQNGANEVFWNSTLPSGVIAAAGYWQSGSSMTEADIGFSEAFSWGTGQDGTTMDIWTIALHEFGHWLNLRDLYGGPDSAKVMYGLCSYGIQKRALHADDAEGMRWIYGLTAEAPTISSLSPGNGPATGGTSVTITGTNFVGLSGVSAVTFGGTNATTYTADSPTQITATAPAHGAGIVQVRVTAAGGPSTDIASFAYYHTYTITYSHGTGGTITGTTPQTVAHGASGTAVVATPDPGYHFVSWSDGLLTAARTDSNVTGNITVSASFALDTYTITYSHGTGGTITGTTPQTVAHGASGTVVTAVPATGYHFVSWSDGLLTAARTDSNVTGNITVSASFTLDIYTITYNSYRGNDRYDTAIRLSKAICPAALPAGSGVVLAPGETFPEALCGAPLAAAYGGPVLLTPSAGLRNEVRTEILRLAPSTVFCIGFSTTVITAIRAALPGLTVIPINGTTVYDMSYRVAKALQQKVGDLTGATAIITIGTNFPDALGVSPLACAKLWPILLTEPITKLVPEPKLNPKAGQALSELGITQVIKVGTYVTTPANIKYYNLSGADRYFTNANVAKWAQSYAGLTYTHTGIATGDKFPDALAAGPFLAKDRGLLLLSPLNGPVPPPIVALLTANGPAVKRFSYVAMIEPVIGQVKGLLP